MKSETELKALALLSEFVFYFINNEILETNSNLEDLVRISREFLIDEDKIGEINC